MKDLTGEIAKTDCVDNTHIQAECMDKQFYDALLEQDIWRGEHYGAYSYDYPDGIDFSEGGGLSKCFHGTNISLRHYSKRYRTYHPKPYVCQSKEFDNVDSNSYYNMNTYPCGKIVIISQIVFHPRTKLQNRPRLGGEKDVERLTKSFLELGFIVIVLDGLRRDEILKEMNMISKEDFKSLSCFACAILSHGGDGYFYAYDATVKTTEITDLFIKDKLNGKPRLFLIQTCQGVDCMESYGDAQSSNVGKQVDGSDTPIEESKTMILNICPGYDFVIAYAVVKGYRSWRNDDFGSWFIKTLCDEIEMYENRFDFIKMLTKVNYNISLRKTRTKNKEENNKKQISSTVSNLTKDLYLFKHS